MLHEDINTAVKAILSRLGYTFWGTLISEDTIKVFIEHVNIDQCQEISKAVITELKVIDADFVDGFNWEFSSPGLDRYLFELQHFNDFLGEKVKIKTKQGTTAKGSIVRVCSENVFLQDSGNESCLNFSAIKTAQIMVNI